MAAVGERLPIPAVQHNGDKWARVVMHSVAMIIVQHFVKEDIKREPPRPLAQQQVIAGHPWFYLIMAGVRRAPVRDDPLASPPF